MISALSWLSSTTRIGGSVPLLIVQPASDVIWRTGCRAAQPQEGKTYAVQRMSGGADQRWSGLRRRRLLRDHADVVVNDLKKAAIDIELLAAVATEAQHALAEERHHGSVAREDADLPVIRGRDDRIRRPL